MMPWLGAVKTFARMLGLSVVFAYPAIAASEPATTPVIRTEISPRQAMVGQTVTLKVDVLVPSWFTAPIDYPTAISIPGVTAQLSNSAAINLNEHIDNQSYAGMSKLYTVVAQQAGEFKLPPMRVKVSYSVDGATRVVTLQTTPQTFRATLPAGAEDLGYFFATPNYSLKQTTDRPLHRLKVGDALVRQIIQRAEGVAAMNLPGLKFAELDGTSVYPAEALLDDTGGERGKVRIGERVDAVTYILRKPGPVELPGLKIGWFDTANGKMRWTSVPTLHFDVSPDPNAMTSVVPPPQATNSGGAGVSQSTALCLQSGSAVPSRHCTPNSTGEITLRTKLMRAWRSPATLPTLAVLSGLLLAALLLKRKGIHPLLIWRTWRQRRRDAESAHFKRCIANLRDADANTALNVAMLWLNQITPDGRGASLMQFAADYGDNEFRSHVKQQQDQLFGQGQPGNKWDAISFRRSLIQARLRWLRSRRTSSQQSCHLPPLNPAHDSNY